MANCQKSTKNFALCKWDGYEFVRIIRYKSIIENYECNEFAEYAPGYISIGNDNGDRELIYKCRKGAVLCGF